MAFGKSPERLDSLGLDVGFRVAQALYFERACEHGRRSVSLALL